jgi:hypothetical protein
MSDGKRVWSMRSACAISSTPGMSNSSGGRALGFILVFGMSIPGLHETITGLLPRCGEAGATLPARPAAWQLGDA